MTATLRFLSLSVTVLVSLLDGALSTAAAQPAFPRRLGGGAAFVPNAGQWDGEVQFIGRVGTSIVRIEPGALLLVQQPRAMRPGHAVRLTFLGGSEAARLEGEEPLPGVVHHLVGDHSRHRTYLPRFASVLTHDLYPGVDLRLRERAGHLEYDLLLKPGADPAQVRVRCEGIEGLRTDVDGGLLLETPVGAIRQPLPSTWEVLPSGEQRALSCSYRLLDPTSFGFTVSGRTAGNPLVIDPGLEWATYLGGSQVEEVRDVAVRPDGHVLVLGETNSLDFPVTPGVVDVGASFKEGFICSLEADGAVVFSTYLGGTQQDDGVMAADFGTEGDIVVGGWTFASDFPTTVGAFDTTKTGFSEGFVTRLSADGSRILYSTLLGVSYGRIERLQRLPMGDIIVQGDGGSNFPTTPAAFDSQAVGITRILARLDPTLSRLVYSTFFGGAGDHIQALAVTPAEDLVLVGSYDPSFNPLPEPEGVPFTPGLYKTDAHGYYVASLSADGSTLRFATQIGGVLADSARAVALDPWGNLVIAGNTDSFNYPVTPDAIDVAGPDPGGLAIGEVFLTVLDPEAKHLLYSTFLGAPGNEGATDVLVDNAGSIHLAGWASSFFYPTTPGAFDVFVNASDLFVTKLAPDRRSLHYSTLLGGSDYETWAHLALDPFGSVVVATTTSSTDFPTTPGAYQPTFAGPRDAVIAKLDLLPTGVKRFGTSTPGCHGPLVVGVTALPQAGREPFGVNCTSAPPLRERGLLVVATQALETPLLSSGALVWLDPEHIVGVIPVASDLLGYSELRAKLPEAPDVRVHLQYFWRDLCAPQGWSASKGLTLVIQP